MSEHAQKKFFLMVVIVSISNFFDAAQRTILTSDISQEQLQSDELHTLGGSEKQKQYKTSSQEELLKKCEEANFDDSSERGFQQRCHEEYTKLTAKAEQISRESIKPTIDVAVQVVGTATQPVKQAARNNLVIAPNDTFNAVATICAAGVTAITSYFTKTPQKQERLTMLPVEEITTQQHQMYEKQGQEKFKVNAAKKSPKTKLRHRVQASCKNLVLCPARVLLPYIFGFGTYKLIATNEPVKESICNNATSVTNYFFGEVVEQEKTNFADNPKK